MAHIPELMAAGVPARLARMLGQNRLRTIVADGSGQDGATPLFTNYCLVEAAIPGAGVRLGYASGAALTALYCLGPETAHIYPAEDEAFNDLDPNMPLSLAAGNALFAVPAVDHWLVLMSGLTGNDPAPPVPLPPSPGVLQYETPLSGATVVMATNDLVAAPAALLDSLTIRLPAAPSDGTIVRGMSTQAIMTLSWAADSGAAIVGVPVFVAAGAAWALRWHALSASWFNWT